MLNRLIKNFCFIEPERKNLIFSDITKVRLNTENKVSQRIMLKDQGGFSEDDNLFIETGFVEAQGLKKWLLFEAIFKSGENTPFVLPVGTSLGFKVKTTGDNYYFDIGGAGWSVAGLSDWNTETEISENISTFPIATVGNKKIGFIVNLKTTDKNLTPEVFKLKLLGEFDVEYFDDLVYDSVIRLLNSSFRSSSVVVFNTGSLSISSIDLNSVLKNKGYNIFNVETVYNMTDDPMKLVNLHDSYAVGATKQDGFTFKIGTETFNAPIPSGKWVEVVFKYVPEISVKVNQDYFEAPAYPHIVFTRISEVERKGFVMRNTNSFGRDFIRDKVNGVAVEQRSPSQRSYRFDFMLFTTEIDQFKLIDALRNFFANTKELLTFGLGNKHNIEIVDEIDTIGNSTTSDSSDTNLSKGSFDVLGVLFYDKPSIDVPIVTSLNLSITQQ